MRSVLHSLLALASVACCFVSSVFAISMSKSSSAIGPLNESTVGMVYLRMIERDDQEDMVARVLPFYILQLPHTIGVASI